MLDRRQIRAARALLGWSRDELAAACGVSLSALMRLEHGTADARASTYGKVVAVLSAAGIEFVARENGAIGVVLRPSGRG